MIKKYLIIISGLLSAFSLHANETSEQDMSDPMAVYTGGEIIAGNKGLGATFQFGLNKGDWGLLGKIESKNNFENYRARFFAPNRTTGTGLFVDAGHDFSDPNKTTNYATVGLMQAFKLSDKWNLYSALTYGKTWEENDLFEETDIVTSVNYLKYDFADQFYLQLVPQYTYGLNGEETRDLSAEVQLGYKVNKDNIILLSGDSDNNTWLTFRSRF
ncbi:hypothetical protein [Vibrio sp. VPAP30]|uniref:hypothetical protein n=1 Tax=Vibrio sp. VPAP30 TaxID=1647102 RepID=UPI000659AFFB|nr:hypothetical protein [Vibrio sp. VPAP30]KLN63417.1 hypothetical protein ZX61_17945 [Vibrio sp. VPAP30]